MNEYTRCLTVILFFGIGLFIYDYALELAQKIIDWLKGKNKRG